MDMWWNAGKTQQSIARVLRQGQTSSVVNVYYFTSNLGIERAMFHKHEDKLTIGDEISKGPLVSTVRNIRVADIILILENEDNEKKLNAILARL
jgi:SNF2 family DNA or RNA helicase